MEGEKFVSVQNQFEIFLASPISSFGSASQYINDRYNTLELIRILESKVGTVFYAGRNLPDKENLDGDEEVQKDFEAIRNCNYFIMCYPEKSTSSVLVEAGYALALDKFSIYIVRNLSDLPFLLQFAIRSYKNVLAYESESIEQSALFIEREISIYRVSNGNVSPYEDKIMK